MALDHVFTIAGRRGLVGVLVLVMLSGCAEIQYRFQYHEAKQLQEVKTDAEGNEKITQQAPLVWPSPPEQERFKYIGELSGETNFKPIESSKTFLERLGSFFQWLVGLDTGGNSPMLLRRPQSGVMDDDGRMYVTDVGRHSVLMFDTQKGEFAEWTQAGAQEDFKTPVGIAISSQGKIYVADADWGFIVELDKEGNPIRNFGKGILQRPTGLVYDTILHQLYVADTHAHDIKVFNVNGELVDNIGQKGSAPGEFNSPTHLAFSRGKLYVTDTFNTRVQVLSRNGDVSHQIGQRGLYIGNLIRPKGVATDSQGNIYVIESYADYLLVYNAKGDFLLPIGGTGSEAGKFYLPSGVWTDSKDRIYIADMFNGRIVVLQYIASQYSSEFSGMKN
ncbi:MAG: 6-bladed beta-propeller [Gammaproteobacteria bacterium]|nr:6-bladed beta-propeller [Gammaproteobacteria bacterium]MDH5800820.1 6-bladed beta-propeller [Gammaproteobacteria bacterium]